MADLFEGNYELVELGMPSKRAIGQNEGTQPIGFALSSASGVDHFEEVGGHRHLVLADHIVRHALAHRCGGASVTALAPLASRFVGGVGGEVWLVVERLRQEEGPRDHVHI